MNPKPIQFKDLGLSFTHKRCFSAFSGKILYGNKSAQELSARLLKVRLPEIITPKFHIQAADHLKTIITVREGNISYRNKTCRINLMQNFVCI